MLVVLTIEWAIYTWLNIKVVYQWVGLINYDSKNSYGLFVQISQKSLNTLVNKFLFLNRLYGLMFVTLELVRGKYLLSKSSDSERMTESNQDLMCSAEQFLVKFLALCFWSNHVIIAIIRYCFVVYPIETHNSYPRKEDKNDLFIKIFR